MAKKKEEVIGACKLVCHREKWTSYKQSCDRILSIQNCAHFFGTWQPCECFEMQELDIRERELERIEQMILETQENGPVIEELEVKLSQEDEPPLPDTPRKKRRRRRKRSEIEQGL